MNRRAFLTGLAGLSVAAFSTSQAFAGSAAQQATRKPAGPLTLEEALADPTAPGQPEADYVYRMRAYRRGGRTGGAWRNAVLRARARRRRR